MANNKLFFTPKLFPGRLIKNFIVTCTSENIEKFQVGWQDHEWDKTRFLKAASQCVVGPIKVIQVYRCKHQAEYNAWKTDM